METWPRRETRSQLTSQGKTPGTGIVPRPRRHGARQRSSFVPARHVTSSASRSSTDCRVKASVALDVDLISLPRTSVHPLCSAARRGRAGIASERAVHWRGVYGPSRTQRGCVGGRERLDGCPRARGSGLSLASSCSPPCVLLGAAAAVLCASWDACCCLVVAC